MFHTFIILFAIIGVYAFACFLDDNIRAPLIIFRSACLKLVGKKRSKNLVKCYGKWAAITGSTDGIGKAYARELAKRGLNVILMARSRAKLIEVAKEIEDDFRVQARIIVVDFTKGQEVYEHIENELGSLPVRLFVNNVGTSTPSPGYFTSFTPEELWNVINTNIGAVTQLSRHFIIRMCDMAIKGIIINISSGTELYPVPFGAIYAATKAYTRSLTLALQYEAKHFGIEVQLVSPHFVVTKINSYSRKLMRGNLLIPSPEEYARWAVDTIGEVDETTGYYWHAIENTMIKILPTRLRNKLAILLAKYLIDDTSK